MELWYPHKGKYKKNDPSYFDLRGTDWYDQLTSEIPAIKEQVLALLKKDSSSVEDFFNKAAVATGKWQGIPFLFWGARNEALISGAKDIFSHFEHIPGLVSCNVSILQPNTKLREHNGDTNAIYRIHLPIYIPAQLPECGLKVDGVTKPWIENEMIVFCDAHRHEAWNLTDQTRIIIILDVIRPEFLNQQAEICAVVMASMKYQYVANKYKIVVKIAEWTPLWIKNIIRKFLKFTPFG